MLKPLVFLFALTPTLAFSAILSDQRGGNQGERISSTEVVPNVSGYELNLATDSGAECTIPKAVAQKAGYNLGSLQLLVTLDRTAIIQCFGYEGSKGIATSIRVQNWPGSR